MSQQHHILPVRLYLGIFAALMVFTIVTVWVSGLNLGPFNTLVALGIAGVKATLVVLYFMHLRYGSRLTWVFASAGFLWLALLLGLTLSDYLSRTWYLP